MKTLTRWFIILLLLIAVIAWNSLSGCTQIPLCEKFTMHPATGPHGQTIFWMTEENLEKMMSLIDGIRGGTCRLED